MMSVAKKMVPKRRFKEFLNAGDWKQCKLSEVVTINPKTELPDEFKYVDLESVVGTNLLGFQVIKKGNAPSRAQRLASYGDVFYQTVRPYQRNNYLFENIDKDMVFSTGYAQLRSKLDSYFLLTLVQNDNFVKVVLDNCTGTSYPAINGSELGKITVQIPSNDAEANQIGKVFRGIDNIITLHQRKLDKLQATKKALLQEMFPEEGQDKPKRRFKDFTDAWEQRKLGEIADITKLAGFEFTKYIVYSDKGNIIALRGLNIKDGDLNLEDVKYIDSSDFTKLKRSKLFRNDILFTYVGTIGEVARIQEADKYYLAPNVSRIRIKNRLLSEFLMYYMDRDLFYQKIIFPLIATSSQPALSMANIREFNITYPSDTNEQQKIALVFNRISHLITLHQRKLDKLKNLKQAYLNEMFV